MRKIKVEKWEVTNQEGEKVEETLLHVLNALIGNRKPDQMGKGVDGFRVMNRLSKAFDKAEKSGVLELEEVDYKSLKEIVETDIPDVWGLNKNISTAVEAFLGAEIEK
jgi:hypothetical protein